MRWGCDPSEAPAKVAHAVGAIASGAQRGALAVIPPLLGASDCGVAVDVGAVSPRGAVAEPSGDPAAIHARPAQVNGAV